MGYSQNNGITWKELESANVKRLPEFKNKHGQPAHSEPDGSDWSEAQWLQAVIGELGEYANIRKKFERGDLSQQEFNKEAAHELADVVIYLSILAFRLGVDLDKAVREKFNIVSDRVGSSVYIGNDWEWHLKEKVEQEKPTGLSKGLTDDPAHPDLNIKDENKNGQNKVYLVLSEQERAKGFVRPVRSVYVHDTCKTETRMSMALAETYARDPYFYGATFCANCKDHFPVAEFKWLDGETVGS